jgi:putative Ig domain-containing protein
MKHLLLKSLIVFCVLMPVAISTAKTPISPATPLAGIDGGGAITLFEESGKIFFSDYNQKELHSVSAYGGEIKTHYTEFDLSPWVVLHRDGRIYSLAASTAGSIYSIPDTAEGITVLSQRQNFNGFLGQSVSDLLTDGQYVYWAEHGFYSGALSGVTKVLRASLTPQMGNPIDLYCGCSTDALLPDLAGVVHLALDGNRLFVSEGATGKINRVDLSTGVSTPLATTGSSGVANSIPLLVTNSALFALLNEKDIVKIDKNTGAQTVAATATFIMGGRVRADVGGVYWWEPGFLKRLDSVTGIVSTVTQASFYEVYDFYSDGADVWWFDRTQNAQLELQHAPISGGAPIKVGEYASTLIPGQIFSNSTSLFWISSDGLIQLSKAGGSPAVLTSEVAGNSLPAALTADHVIFRLWLGGVAKIPQTGQLKPTKEWTATFPSGPGDMAMDEDHLYWLVENWNPNYTSLMSKLLSGGNAVELGTTTAGAIHLFPYGNTIFVSEETATGGQLASFPKSGGPETVLLTTDPARPVNIAVKDDLVYFNLECDIIEFCSVSGLYTYDLNTSVVTTLIPSTFPFHGLHIDESYVYWTEFMGVGRVPRTGGSVQMLNSGVYNWGLTGDDSCLFWANGWEIMRMAKPGRQCPKPPTINTAALPQGEVGRPYDADLQIDGGLPPYSAAISRGFLPSGLSIADASISGIPTVAGNKSMTITVADAVGVTTTKSVKLSIAAPLGIALPTLKAGTAGKSYSATIKVAGGKAPFTWSIISGSLPNGIILQSFTGKITGVSSSAGTYNFTVRVTDGLGATAEHAYTLVVN